jgi:fatty-acyl-CoA synthase
LSVGLAPISERRAALEARFPRWEPRTLDQMLDWAVEQFGDRPYVITDERTCSYREMQRWSVGIARGLTAAGVRSGDHVALVMANYPEFVAVKYAIARAGAVAVPINFLNRRDELGYVLEQSDAVALITMDRFRDLDYLAALDDLAPGWEYHGGGERFPRLHTIAVFATSPDGGRTDATSLEALTSAGDQVTELTMPADPSSPADILYTSGTTGSPKGVLLTHDMLLRTAYAAAHHRAFQDGRRIIFSLPMYHVYGYGEGMLPALFCGGAIIPQLVFDPVATLRGVERHRADDALLIPTMTMGMLDALRAGTYDLSSLTAVISSGAPSPPGIWPEIFELLSPEELTTGYGMTETTASATCTRPDDPIERLRETNGRLRDAGVAGDPQLGGRLVVYRVVDPATGREVGPGALGELRARGPGVTPGYYDKPEETAAAFDDEGWLRTGDLGRIDADDYITLVGRDKDVYRCGGEQVVPKEVEDLLTTHPAVAQAHVVPLADERMGEVGVAWVIFRDGAFAEREELIAFCAKRLARFKVPQHVLPITAEQLPTTASGRARKFLLVERAARELGGQ